MSNSRLLTDILLYLYEKAPDDKTSLTELCEVLGGSTRECVVEALDHLAAKQYVARTGLDRLHILCWLTDIGRVQVGDLLGEEFAESGAQEEASHVPPVEEYPDSSLSLDELDPQYAYIVQRHDVVKRIQKIIESPSDKRIAFLYGLPRVGKTFVLHRLREALPDQYLPVSIHVNGWLSITGLARFLNELAGRIKYGVECSEIGCYIEPFIPGSEPEEATAQFSRFMDNLVQSVRVEGKTLLLMFDDIEYLVQAETDRRILEYLTGCIETYLDHQVSFVFAGSGHMLGLLESGSMAMLWTRGEPIQVGCFSEETSRHLATAKTRPHFRFEPSAMDRVLRLTDGHPDLLQRTLAIVVRQWRNVWRSVEITDVELKTILEDIYIELTPQVKDIWRGLSLPEKIVLQQIARKDGRSFREHEVVLVDKLATGNPLYQLVKRQILDYVPEDELYTVRLGLLVESLAFGILSVNG